MGSMTAFVDELVKLSQGAPIRAAQLALKNWKPIGLVGAGALGMNVGQRELDKYLLGRRLYERMQAGG